MTKGNTRFRASLILKRELWHPETWKCSRSTAVTFGMLFTNSFIYLDFLPFERTAPSFNVLLCSFRKSIRIFLPLRWISNSWSGHCSGMKVPAALRILDITQLYFWKSAWKGLNLSRNTQIKRINLKKSKKIGYRSRSRHDDVVVTLRIEMQHFYFITIFP